MVEAVRTINSIPTHYHLDLALVWEKIPELGNWGDGEIGSWGVGEIGSWGDWELGSWGVGEIGKDS